MGQASSEARANVREQLVQDVHRTVLQAKLKGIRHMSTIPGMMHKLHKRPSWQVLVPLDNTANRTKWISSTECALYVHTEQPHWTSCHPYILYECQRMPSPVPRTRMLRCHIEDPYICMYASKPINLFENLTREQFALGMRRLEEKEKQERAERVKAAEERNALITFKIVQLGICIARAWAK